ncbi:hypothetical protein Purlil1_11502 [Purpureocillium lilacinum]|uniref:Uncharacterized protein n=1 Tax=Purpureocillium lilacinum TaxID=33203 RepID=A0ABR0BJR1_PURLI|nr:hypothetical protein Purlil1_11502 [Purpureocillium lilacinum]
MEAPIVSLIVAEGGTAVTDPGCVVLPSPRQNLPPPNTSDHSPAPLRPPAVESALHRHCPPVPWPPPDNGTIPFLLLIPQLLHVQFTASSCRQSNGSMLAANALSARKASHPRHGLSIARFIRYYQQKTLHTVRPLTLASPMFSIASPAIRFTFLPFRSCRQPCASLSLAPCLSPVFVSCSGARSVASRSSAHTSRGPDLPLRSGLAVPVIRRHLLLSSPGSCFLFAHSGTLGVMRLPHPSPPLPGAVTFTHLLTSLPARPVSTMAASFSKRLLGSYQHLPSGSSLGRPPPPALSVSKKPSSSTETVLVNSPLFRYRFRCERRPPYSSRHPSLASNPSHSFVTVLHLPDTHPFAMYIAKSEEDGDERVRWVIRLLRPSSTSPRRAVQRYGVGVCCQTTRWSSPVVEAVLVDVDDKCEDNSRQWETTTTIREYGWVEPCPHEPRQDIRSRDRYRANVKGPVLTAAVRVGIARSIHSPIPVSAPNILPRFVWALFDPSNPYSRIIVVVPLPAIVLAFVIDIDQNRFDD